jgi:outer membrane protein TolC
MDAKKGGGMRDVKDNRPARDIGSRTRTTTAVMVGAARGAAVAVLSAAALAVAPGTVAAQAPSRVIDLTLETMVDLALSSSYQVRQLNLDIDRTRLNLKAERARLRSRVDMEVSAPDLRSISENLWNSDLGRYEIIQENSRRFEAELSIRQPVILLGHPTNGYLSLNNRVYRYTQVGEGGEQDQRYYNRAFVEYTQPLFQPNELRNDIEEAELELEDSELGFYEDVVEIVDDVSQDYFELFEEAYGEEVNGAHVANLEAAGAAAEEVARADSSRAIDVGQIRVELANAREQLQQSRSGFRLEATRLKTRLDIPEGDSITLTPVITIMPITIDPEAAVALAFELTPRMRQLGISHREDELDLEQTKGRGGVQIDLSVSYGREMQDPVFQQMWSRPTNTYTVGVNGEIPIWDWGERRARIDASRISLQQTQLRIEQAETDIRASVQNEIRNVAEYQSRALAMQDNLRLAGELAEESLRRYRLGDVSALDLLQSFRREVDTAENLLDAYLGWKRAISELQEMTFFDFERGLPVLERFGIELQPAT